MRALATALIMLLGFSAVSAQDYVFDTEGETELLNFNGYDQSVNDDPAESLSATLSITLNSITAELDGNDNPTGNNVWIFALDLANTSVAPNEASRITTLGFNMNPEPLAGSTSDTSDFSAVLMDFDPANPNLHIPHEFGDIQVCLTDGNNCSGGGDGGVLAGDNDSFFIAFIMDGSVDELTFSNFGIRYQSLSTGSGSGAGVVTIVPEPSTWIMMILGFGIVASASRRRRSAQATLA